MKRYCFTFGAGQYYGLLANHYVLIDAPDEHTARVVMHGAFGGKWSMSYDDPLGIERMIREYNLKLLGILDQFGNILQRG